MTGIGEKVVDVLLCEWVENDPNNMKMRTVHNQ